MNIEKHKKRDWVDIGIKIFTPVVAGLLIAWAGFVSNYTLTSVSSKQESARLITELQISREQAESELRKDVFDQTLQAFLLKNQEHDYSIRGMSKQLLRLELLALNFGDSLSLSPLFAEVREDLKNPNLIVKSHAPTFDEDKGELRKRLYSLARRVASTQVSSLEHHGISKNIDIPLTGFNKANCDLLHTSSYPWPTREIHRGMGIYDDNNNVLLGNDDIKSLFKPHEVKLTYKQSVNTYRLMSLNDINRYLELVISDIDHCNESAKVTVTIYKEINNNLLPLPSIESRDNLKDVANHGLIVETTRSFNLDYFNFPMVDNTRLEKNHRFAIVLDDFDKNETAPYMNLITIIFPSEYASLRDRPGMEEARKMLESALRDEGGE